jgi:hypothetical protein
VFFRPHPATGDAQPVESTAAADWDGHYSARLEVPTGGPGRLEVGFEITVCAQSGACDRFDALADVGGVGPPPDSPITLIATASILPPVTEVVAGRPFDLEIALSPNADWEPGAFEYPAELVIDVREARGESIAVVPATLDAAAGPIG